MYTQMGGQRILQRSCLPSSPPIISGMHRWLLACAGHSQCALGVSGVRWWLPVFAGMRRGCLVCVDGCWHVLGPSGVHRWSLGVHWGLLACIGASLHSSVSL